ncbi:Tissue alpha-l-fucosidase [Lasiodiplodia theobromae]|uniref:Tissue alpha-l-fucosidase n=1 Tax=Lasiodiplodia theobromae TaxID=45133 RepID=UPI0015C3A06D|nr:Tissue alpha-l-fucosidase [Lasiodiplodia theobromae]KAF4541935.1 Tissue alpha-l-fucosidase [Lasiodiplodia theobromae]
MVLPTFGAAYLLVAAVGCAAAPSPLHGRSANTSQAVSIPLTQYLNNRAFGSFPGDADFDGSLQSYPAAELKYSGSFISSATGVDYLFPAAALSNSSDNVLCLGQTVPVPPANYLSAQLLVASDKRDTIVSDNITFIYADNTTSVLEIRAEPWWAFLTMYKGEIILPYRFLSNDTNFNTTHVYEWTGALDPTKQLTAISLPSTSNTTTGRMHVFALSLRGASGVQVHHIRPTQKQDESGAGVQIVEVTVGNSGPSWIHGDGVEVSIEAPGVETVRPAQIKRLRVGDQKKVNVGVVGSTNGTAVVKLSSRNETITFTFPDTEFGLKDYTESLDSLTLHESPEWFNNAKFGIFIHWGPYSVPGWGNSTPYEVYAEWYWWYSHHLAADKADTYDYHLRTFGPDVNYDDFFANFTAANYDPKAWVDLFADAGAQYFVFTTKHHDGFAGFDTKETSNRNSLKYGPKRDLLRELFDAAKTYQPHLHRGTYFSLPEWYNPDFGPYGFAQNEGNASTSWPGILATNQYTGETEPYTGHVPVADFIADVMVPQQEILAYDYETEIMWCDCGAANGSAAFAAAWFNRYPSATMNSRCGIAQGSDFDTPEYTTFSSVSPRKWESNQGMDPYSYGFNRATADDAYMNASTVVKSLVDMVSKNGNLLLDIGPRADGSIVEVEAENLRRAGTWIKKHDEAIFNTTYWFVTPEVGDVRFTQNDEAFYVLFLEEPVAGADVLIEAPLPVLPGDSVTVLGEGLEVEWEAVDGGVSFTWPAEMEGKGEYCWVVKIGYTA